LFFFQGQVGRPPKTSGKAAKKAGKARKNITKGDKKGKRKRKESYIYSQSKKSIFKRPHHFGWSLFSQISRRLGWFGRPIIHI
jgi:hypothetical protein